MCLNSVSDTLNASIEVIKPSLSLVEKLLK